MNIATKKLSFVLLFLLFYAPSILLAQGVTTSAMNGVVLDKDGQPLPGATVIATHVPTGTNYGTTTRADGKFNLNNLRVGGPYSVKVTFIGYTTQSVEGITLKLGQNYNIDFKLTSETIQTGTVSVVADKNALISSSRTGAATNVGLETIQAFPTITRNFQDFAKLTPQFDGRSNSAAGRNARFNNIQLDGTQYNDLFGLGSSGTPGGTAGTTPISLDAIQEFQVVIAPYDVKMSGFTGGGINAITRSGTNNFSGSAYYLGRNQNFTGYKPDASRAKYGSFTDYTTGFRLGGPVLKDKLFFFVSGELGRRTEPIYNTVLNLTPALAATADRAKAQAIKYGYNPGSYDETDALRPSNKLFLRFDYNLSDEHKLVARLNYVDAAQDNLGRSSNQLGFSDRNYEMNSKTFSPVLQLTSTFSNTMTNELTLGYTSIRDHRVPESTAFPSIRINDGSNNIRLGGEEYSQANQLDQDIFEFTDNFTYYMGSHVFTIGTHNEFFKFRNLYIANQDGYYLFNSIADFEAGKIAQYQLSYANNGDRELAAKFNAIQFGAYVQDEWTVTPNFKATLGLRIDIPTFPDDPAYNAKFDAQFGSLGLGTNKVPSGKILFSPRLGLNWDASGDRSLQVRGGIGLFTGRIPYVWISNQYGNTGVEFTRLNVNNPAGLVFGKSGAGFNTLDPLMQPKEGMAGLSAIKTSEVDVTDKDFKMPQILRINGAVDKTLPFGLTGTVEAIYSKSINDMVYQDLNLKADPTLANPAFSGNRVMYSSTKVNSNFTNVVLMKNTSDGFSYSLTGQVQGTLPFGVFLNAAYTYNRSKDLNSVTSSQAYSNYQYNPVQTDPNSPTLATSNFEIRHRIMFAVSYGFEYFSNYKTTVSLFYNGQSGRPYSYTYASSVNGDGANTNDLLYIPTADEVSKMNMGKTQTTGGKTFFVADPTMNANFEKFIESDDYLNSHRGQIMERNSLREPWVNMLDLKLSQEVALFANHKVELSLDILNVLNLLKRDWGWVNTIPNQNYSVLSYTKTTGDSKDVYGFTQAKDVVTKNPKNDFFSPDDLASRFQFQLGIRYAF
ncbi:MAG: carboxypeptidase regulatory-like domain-containing protein [Bacteroidota bacterium]|nr:carboxypeptidase regulatory-like domain-containing protein [Bacteroidota bacterium]